MILETVVVGPLQCNCYILGCEESREAFVIDPGEDAALIIPVLERHALRVKYILSTHAHIDHVGDLEKIKDLTKAEALLHERDLPLYSNLETQARWLGVPVPTTTTIDHFVSHGDQVGFGIHRGEILSTPGHTPGSVCLHLPDGAGKLFAGDTLFFRSIGRTDLWGGSQQDILKSIREKILTLEGSTMVFPGHGRPTTIDEERRSNPFL